MGHSTTEVPTDKGLNRVIKIDEAQIQDHLGEMVRQSVEETLNGMLDAEAERLCNARRYERSADRADTRAGHYTRTLHTKAGEVELKMPKLRTLPFETQIIKRYQRRESSVEEALIEMYLAGVSVRRVEDITRALWGTRVKPSTVSDLNQKIYDRIDAWRNTPIDGRANPKSLATDQREDRAVPSLLQGAGSAGGLGDADGPGASNPAIRRLVQESAVSRSPWQRDTRRRILRPA